MENEMMINAVDKPAETTDSMLSRLALEINAIKEQTRKTVYLAMMDIGQRLLQAKGTVGHGNWEKWLKDNVDYSPRTAQRLIASYERFGDGQQKLFGRSVDPEQLAELNKTQIMTLMSIKDEEKCFEFMEEHKEEIKDMSKTELEDIIKKLNETTAELHRTQDKLYDTNSKLRNTKDKLKVAKHDSEFYRKQMSDLQSQLDEAGESQELADIKTKYAALQRDLAKADKQHEKIAEEAGKYQNLFEESQQKVDALTKELEEAKSQPIDATTVEKIVEVEKVPEETKKQLELMQARIRELESVSKDTKTPEEKAFGHHLMNVKSELEASITQLMAIQDEDKKRKYAALLRKLLQGTLSMTSWAE